MNHHALRSFVALFAIGWLAASCRDPVAGSIAGGVSPSAEVDAANLLAHERAWPYRVRLVESWPVAGRDEPLPAGLYGVLIRVEPSGLPRIDFGKLGKYEIPVEKTDLVERANQIRLGKEAKEDPNFVHAIKSRLLDSASDEPRVLPPEEVATRRGFLCVFADPSSVGFEALARALAPSNERSGVMTLLFAQGTHPDAALRDRLRALEWKVPFVYDYLSEPYTRTLLVEGTPFPYVMLQTDEGRVLFQGEWHDGDLAKLDAAFEQGFAQGGDAAPRG